MLLTDIINFLLESKKIVGKNSINININNKKFNIDNIKNIICREDNSEFVFDVEIENEKAIVYGRKPTKAKNVITIDNTFSKLSASDRANAIHQKFRGF